MTHQNGTLKSALQSKRFELERSIRSQSSQLSISEGEYDLIDRVQGMRGRDEAVTFIDALTRTLTQVEAALAAMSEGSYGTCVDCGEPIAARRLEAIPWAVHCIRCQERADRRASAHMAVRGWDEAA